jgi:hypothetical protein
MGIVVDTGKDRLCKAKQYKRKPSILSIQLIIGKDVEMIRIPDTRFTIGIVSYAKGEIEYL